MFIHLTDFFHLCLFVVMVIVLLRYAQVIEKHQNCVLNTASLSTGWICAAGLTMVGNFQVGNINILKQAMRELRAYTATPKETEINQPIPGTCKPSVYNMYMYLIYFSCEMLKMICDRFLHRRFTDVESNRYLQAKIEKQLIELKVS